MVKQHILPLCVMFGFLPCKLSNQKLKEWSVRILSVICYNHFKDQCFQTRRGKSVSRQLSPPLVNFPSNFNVSHVWKDQVTEAACIKIEYGNKIPINLHYGLTFGRNLTSLKLIHSWHAYQFEEQGLSHTKRSSLYRLSNTFRWMTSQSLFTCLIFHIFS